MKFFRVLCFVVGVMILGSASALANPPEKKPVAFFPEKTHKFAKVLEGANVNHDFIVQNKGAALLRIIKVDST